MWEVSRPCAAWVRCFSSCRLMAPAGRRNRSHGLKIACNARRQTTSAKARARAVARKSLMRAPWPVENNRCCNPLPKERSKYTSLDHKKLCDHSSLKRFATTCCFVVSPGSMMRIPGVFVYIRKAYVRARAASIHPKGQRPTQMNRDFRKCRDCFSGQRGVRRTSTWWLADAGIPLNPGPPVPAEDRGARHRKRRAGS
jgi:hypothetical protein